LQEHKSKLHLLTAPAPGLRLRRFHLRDTGNRDAICVFDHRSISALALRFSVSVRWTGQWL